VQKPVTPEEKRKLSIQMRDEFVAGSEEYGWAYRGRSFGK
jgi:hypothetical protein